MPNYECTKCDLWQHADTKPIVCHCGAQMRKIIKPANKSPETTQADVTLNDLLAAVVGRIDEHSKEWENAKAAGEEKVMTRTEGKIREGRKISLMIKEIIKQSS